MHDIRMIREAPEAFDAALARRGLGPVSPAILALDERRRGLIHAAAAVASHNPLFSGIEQRTPDLRVPAS